MEVKRTIPQRIIDFVKASPWACILALILAAQFLLTAVCNIKLIDNNLDCDSAKILLHTRKMWEHGTYLIPGWSYMTTLELDCPAILAVPLYGLIKNIYIAYGIANIILLAGFIGLVFFVFRGKDMIYPLLACNLLCIPYSIGMLDYFNMMFFSGGFYVIRVAMPVFLVALLLWAEQGAGRRKRFYEYVPLVLFAALIFLCAFSSGVYVLFVGGIPILVTYILYKVILGERAPGLSWLILGLCIAFSGVGILMNGIFLEKGRSTGMELISVSQDLGNVYSCFAGIFELFGAIAHDMELPVLSLEGIGIVLKAILVYVFFVCGIIAANQMIQKKKKKIDLRVLLLLSVFVWNLFVLLSTNTRAGSSTYEYRYHLIGMIPLMLIASQILAEAWLGLKRFQKNFFGVAGVIFILAVGGLSYAEALDPTDEQADLKMLCSYCDELGYDYIYLYDASDDADVCRLVTESDSEYLCVTPQGVTWSYVYYEKYVGGPVYPESAIFVVDQNYDFGDSFELFGYKFIKFDTVANRSLYYFVNERKGSSS